ncbi:DedA family protein [Actinotalea ferrariae]|nr:DedA family protein [Actinotalea ferrariae]
MTEWVFALVGSPLVFLALYTVATIDGFFPPIPSESIVIALASLSVSTGEPNLWIVGAVGAAGAFTGDQIAYSIGRRVPVRNLRFMRGAAAQRAVGWAERALAERGAAFIIAARYVPIGRVAVNMTAGAVGFNRVRFSILAAIAAVTWALYSVMLGIGAGHVLKDQPLLGVVVGVVGGILLGLAIDPLIKRFVLLRGRRGRRRVTAPDQAEPAQPVTASSE